MTTEKFHCTLPNGKEIILPKFKQVPAGLARKARHEDAGSQIWTFLEALATKAQMAELDKIPLETFGEFALAWQKDSNVTLGESKASSSS